MIKGNELQEHNELKGRNDQPNLDFAKLIMEGHAQGLFAHAKTDRSGNHEDNGKLDIPPLEYGSTENFRIESSKQNQQRHPHEHNQHHEHHEHNQHHDHDDHHHHQHHDQDAGSSTIQAAFLAIELAMADSSLIASGNLDAPAQKALLANETQMISFAVQMLQQAGQELSPINGSGASGTTCDGNNGPSTPGAGSDGNNGSSTPGSGSDGGTGTTLPPPVTNGGDAVPSTPGDTSAPGKTGTPTDASSALAGFQIPSDKLKGPVITPNFSGGNDTQAINDAVSQAAAKGGGVVHIPAGVYNIDAANAGIIMKDNVSLVMDKGTILQGHSNGAESGCIIDIRNANNVNIYGGKLVGDFGPGASHFGETMNGIDVLGTSSNIDIQGVESDNNKGDGFDINGKGDNIHLAHNVAIGNKRDALSIEGGNHVLVEYNAFLNTGTKDSYDNHFSGGLERLPNSAIDVENNAGQSVNGAIIRNNLLAGAGTKGIDENTSNGWGIRVTGTDDNGTQVLDNTITGNVAGGVGVWSGSGNIVDGNVIDNQPNPYRLFGGSATGSNTTTGG